MAAVASATPSMSPTVVMVAPSVPTMKIGSRLWISSDEASMKSDPNPRAQMAAGMVRHDSGRAAGDTRLIIKRLYTT